MRKAKKLIGLLAVVGAAILCLCLTGCSGKSVDVTKTLKVKFSGVNGYGTATLSDEYDWIDEVNTGKNKLQLAQNEELIRDAVDYTLDKKDHLSNGDEVTVTVKTKEVEGLNIKFKGDVVKVKVEGLKEAETFDPFQSAEIVYDGFAPNGTAYITGGDSSLSYELDKESGLKNGDKITVTVKPSRGSIENYIENYGKVFSPDKKEFTVDGLAAYVTKIDEIPADMQSKMQAQALDTIKARAARFESGCSLKSADFIGNYFLKIKDGASGSTTNEIYWVYKCTTSLSGYRRNGDEVSNEEAVYYTWYVYNDTVILPDGTCSVDLANGKLNSTSFETDIGSRNWLFSGYVLPGYKNLDSMFNDTVTKYIDKYTYVNTVQDTAPAPAESNTSDVTSSDTSATESTSSDTVSE